MKMRCKRIQLLNVLFMRHCWKTSDPTATTSEVQELNFWLVVRNQTNQSAVLLYHSEIMMDSRELPVAAADGPLCHYQQLRQLPGIPMKY